MAHEINNPLAFASSNVEVLERELGTILAILQRYRSGLGDLAAGPPRARGRDRSARNAGRHALPRGEPAEHGPIDPQGPEAGELRRCKTCEDLHNSIAAEIGEIDVNLALDQSLSMLGDLVNRNQIEVIRRFSELPCSNVPLHISIRSSSTC